MNRALLNLVLLAVVLGLASAAYFAKQKKDTPKEKLTAFAASAVTTAEIAWPGAPVIKLVKSGNNWTLTAPVAARVDPLEVLAVSNLASTEVQQSLTPEGLNLKDLGLAPPDHSITLNGQRIDFGGIEPLNARRYVRVGNKVMLVDDPPSAALDRDYHDLVAKDLFVPGEVIISLTLPGGLHFAKAADGQWQAAATNAVNLPAASIKAAAEGWKTAKSLYNETAATPPEAGEALSIGLKDGSTRELIVAATEPQLSLYSGALKIRYVLSKALEATLLPKPEAPAPEAVPVAEPAAAAPPIAAPPAPVGQAPAPASAARPALAPTLAPEPAPVRAPAPAPAPAPAAAPAPAPEPEPGPTPAPEAAPAP